MTVSNEDRDTAVLHAAQAIQGPAYGKASLEKSARAVDALIAHGWGPRPAAVSAVELLEIVTGKWPGGSRVVYRDLVRYFVKRGIEVTDD